MADDLDFESFEDLDNLDWSELEKDHKESAQETEAPPAAAAGGAAQPAPSAGNEAMISKGTSNIDIHYLLDVNLEITVEVGRRQYFISEVLTWDSNSIIELEKLVGEPLSILVNSKPVAKGEVVVVNDKFAIKIIEILDPHDRLLHLQS